MAKVNLKVNNISIFTLFIFIAILIIILFIYFIIRYINIDDNKYNVAGDSVYYDDNLNYFKTSSTSYLKQRINGDYYLYESKNGKTVSTNIGVNPIIYNKNDYKLYLYGKFYQVMSNGDVKSLSGLTTVPKASPTKFYKLKDRKYLMVDSDIRDSDKSFKTTGYLIIELDRQGNPTLANNEINVKKIGSVIIKGSTMNFDVKKEELIYNNKRIKLKNIIGSSNEYKEEKKKNVTLNSKDNSSSNKNSDLSKFDNTYYDSYLKNVINSVNNLSGSANRINDKTANTIKKGEIYFDFSKWISLKSVSSTVTSITINYAVYDPNNEYQSVFISIDDGEGQISKKFLNKNETKYIIRDLVKDHNYKISFGYNLVSNSEDVIEDVVNVKTKVPSCSLNIKKIGTDYIKYNLKIDSEYLYTSGRVGFYVDDAKIGDYEIDMKKASQDGGFSGMINYRSLGYKNELILEELSYNGSVVSIRCQDMFIGG